MINPASNRCPPRAVSPPPALVPMHEVGLTRPSTRPCSPQAAMPISVASGTSFTICRILVEYWMKGDLRMDDAAPMPTQLHGSQKWINESPSPTDARPGSCA
jgi:hypothetical protein